MVIPYLNFAGNCEEALMVYKDVFKGDIVYVQRFKDGPADMGTSHDYGEKIMHAQLSIQDQVLYLSDCLDYSI